MRDYYASHIATHCNTLQHTATHCNTSNYAKHHKALRTRDYYASFLRASRALGGITSIHDLIATMQKTVKQLLTCGMCTVYTYDRENNLLFTLDAASNEHYIHVTNHTVAGSACLSAKPLRIENVYEHAKFKDLAASSKSAAHATLQGAAAPRANMLCCPVLRGSQVHCNTLQRSTTHCNTHTRSLSLPLSLFLYGCLSLFFCLSLFRYPAPDEFNLCQT